MALYSQAEALLNEDAINIPLYFYQSRHLVKPDVKGWRIPAVFTGQRWMSAERVR